MFVATTPSSALKLQRSGMVAGGYVPGAHSMIDARANHLKPGILPGMGVRTAAVRVRFLVST
jgi:hypothetical protein